MTKHRGHLSTPLGTTRNPIGIQHSKELFPFEDLWIHRTKQKFNERHRLFSLPNDTRTCKSFSRSMIVTSCLLRFQVFLRFASKQRDNSLANLEDVIIDDTASIASSTVQSFIQTTDKANNTLTQTAPDTVSQTAADLQELPVVTSCHDLILNVDQPPSSNSSVSSPQDDHIFRI